MRNIKKPKNYSLVKSAIMTGTLVFSLASVRFVDKYYEEQIPYTKEDVSNNIEFENELQIINEETIEFTNKELLSIIQYVLGKNEITREDLLTITTLKIDSELENKDLSELKYLSNLSTLTISNNDVDLNNLKYNINLYNLYINSCMVTNINDISNSINNLILSNVIVLDNQFITPYDLVSLTIRNSNFNNLRIKNPEVLEEIKIDTTSKVDLNVISNCRNLKDIEIVRSPNIINGDVLLQFNKSYIILDDYAPIWMDYSTYSQIRQIDNSNTRRVKDEMKTLDSIIAELDLTNDDEETKLKKITLFVINRIEYDDTKELDENYNYYPMYFALNSDEGICINYSCLWQALANRAGIKSYQLYSDVHTWNIVNDEFYIDSTFIDNGAIVKLVDEQNNAKLANVEDSTSQEFFEEGNEKLLYFYELDLDDMLDRFHDPYNICIELEEKYKEINNIGYVNPNSVGRLIIKNQTKMIKLKIMMGTILLLLVQYTALNKIKQLKDKKEKIEDLDINNTL